MGYVEDLLKRINLNRFYQVGALFSFLIFISSLTIEIKFMNNTIIALYSLSALLFFFGVWASICKEVGIYGGYKYEVERHKKVIIGIVAYLLAFIILIIAIILTYRTLF